MRILLLRPPDPLLGRMSLWPPLGLSYLAAALPPDHEVEILDAQAQGWSVERCLRELEARQPDLLGVSMHTQSWLSVRALLREARRALPGLVTVMGGPHVSGEPVATLLELPWLDYGIRGEAEVAFPLLVNLLDGGAATPQALASVPGLVFRRGDGLHVGEATRIENLASLPRPARHLLHEDRYPRNQLFRLGLEPHALIGASRGCPQACAFCGIRALHGPGIRLRDPRDVLAEVDEMVAARGVRTLLFVDDNLTAERTWSLELFAGLAERHPGLAWSPVHGLRLDTLDPELVRAMERSSCLFFYCGLESGSQRVLDRVNKGSCIEDTRARIAMIRRHSRIAVGGWFILGLPGETLGDVLATLRFARELRLERAVFLPATLSPGSPLHRAARDGGWLGDGDGGDYTVAAGYRLMGRAARQPQLPEPTLQVIHLLAYAGFYAQPHVLARAPRHISPRGLAQALRVVRETFRRPEA